MTELTEANTNMPDDETRISDADVAEILEPMPVTYTVESLGLELPDDRGLRDEALLNEIGNTRTQAGELLGSFQRVAAEFDNYRKRTERDRVDTVLRASQRVIESLLPALDSLDAAMAIEPTTDAELKMLDGMRSTHDQILEALKGDGFAEIEAAGEPFDPAMHEAVSVIPGDGDQVVDQVVRKGYAMNGRVLRPALVVVGHSTTAASE